MRSKINNSTVSAEAAFAHRTASAHTDGMGSITHSCNIRSTSHTPATLDTSRSNVPARLGGTHRVGINAWIRSSVDHLHIFEGGRTTSEALTAAHCAIRGMDGWNHAAHATVDTVRVARIGHIFKTGIYFPSLE